MQFFGLALTKFSGLTWRWEVTSNIRAYGTLQKKQGENPARVCEHMKWGKWDY